ncbi:MAG: sulfatase-like hydrolase/transferase [Thermoanaerobaculales bacterium]
MGWRSWVAATGVILIGFSASGVQALTSRPLANALAAGETPPSYDLRVVADDGGPRLEAGSVVSVTVEVANEGSLPWIPEEGFHLSYHWLDAAHKVVVWDGRRINLPATVPPGGTIRLAAEIEAPGAPGDYFLTWDVVHEGVRWVSEADPTAVVPRRVTVVAGSAFSVTRSAGRRVMVEGSEVRVDLELRNDGSRPWLSDRSFALSYHWFSSGGDVVVWDGRRTFFPREVTPGETVALQAVVDVPRGVGRYRLQWDVVEEGVCWFSERAEASPPLLWVWVAPDPVVDPRWWALLGLLAAAAACSVLIRGGPRILVVLFAAGDLGWCAGSLAVKQGFVLAEAGVRPDGGGWLMIWGGAAALALLTRLLPRRFGPWACWALAAAGTMVLWVDLVYLRFFGDLPAPAALSAAGQLGRVGASISSLLASRDIWLWLDLLPGLVLVLAAERLRRRFGNRLERAGLALLVAAVVLGAGAAVHLAVTGPGLLQQVFRRVAVAREVGVLNLHFLDGGRQLGRRARRAELDPGRYREAVEWFAQRAPQRAGVGPLFGEARGANLVMVQVESLQGFVIGLEVGGLEVTPFLNRWTEDALYFPDVTDQTGQGRSSDSELVTQVSLLPFAGGAAAFRFPNNDFTGLAEVLGENGYRCFSAVAYDGAFWNRRTTHPAFGFASSLFDDDFAAGETIGWGLNDRDFLIQSVDRMDGSGAPFCAYLLTLSLHHPFAGFPEHLKVLDVGSWEGTPFGNFLHTMHFLDGALEAFVLELEKRGLLETTVIAVWGDHDAGFAWRPETASAMGAGYDPSGWYLSQEVPLFIRLPGQEGPRGAVRVAAGHADVTPTLLALLGVEPAPYAFVGRNLLGAPGDAPVVGEYGCWRDRRHLFLQGSGSLEDGSCYDLETMGIVPPTECSAGFGAARLTEAMSSLVLEHDLQERIHHDLVGRAEEER